MGILHHEQCNYDLAEGCYSEALALQTELENINGQANLLALLGTMAYEQGDTRKAKPLFTRSLALHRQIDSPTLVTPLEGLGYIALTEGDIEGARGYLHECLEYALTMEQPRFIIMALESIAHLAVATAQPQAAARLWGAASALRSTIDAPVTVAIQAIHAAAQQRAQQQCSAADWHAAWADGAALSIEQAIAEAAQL